MKHYFKTTVAALCLGFSITATQAQDTTSGLVFYLPFDGDMTERVSSSAPSQMSGITLGEGKFGGGILAAGNLSGLIYPVEILANNWPEGSAAAWVKFDEASPSTTTLVTSNWHAQLISRNRTVESDVGSNANYQTASQFPPDVWTHVASTWRKTGDKVNLSFYVNGQKAITEIRDVRNYPDFKEMYIATWGGAFAHSLNGNMDEVVFYDRQLSDGDIAALHLGPAQGTAPSTPPVVVRDPSIFDGRPVIVDPGQRTFPTERPVAVPTVPSDEAPARRLVGTNWQIVDVERKHFATRGTMEKREQLKFSVTLKKTGFNAKQPVRIAIWDTNETEPWKGTNTLTRYDIDTGVGKTITQDILVSYNNRFVESGDKFKFIIGLNNPDGTPFEDNKMADHKHRISLDITEPVRTVSSELEEAEPQSEVVHKRSKVAGRTGDYTIQHTSGLPHTLLSKLQGHRHPNTVLCMMEVQHSPLWDKNESIRLDDINVCNGEDTRDGLASGPSIGSPSIESKVVTTPTSRAVVGIRVCTSDDVIKFAHDRTVLKAQFQYRPFTGSKLDMNSQKKVVQFDTTVFGSCEWRPWSYCPKDNTGQRMVATGIEAHIEDFDKPGERNSIVGTRLMCEPLSQVVGPTN